MRSENKENKKIENILKDENGEQVRRYNRKRNEEKSPRKRKTEKDKKREIEPTK